MSERELRRTFDEDAELYHRARPGYPAELIAALAELGSLAPGSEVLEIGPGTGQATRAMAAAGWHVVAVELGASLAAKLRQTTTGLDVDVLVGSFENVELPEQSRFDAVTAFTSWHWLTPGRRVERVHALLRPGGVLATVTTEHVLGGTTQFFADAQRCYETWDPTTPPDLRLQPADDLAPYLDEVDDSDLFASGVRRRFGQDITYSTQGYLDVLGSYSGHRALPEDRRAGLLADIADLIDHRYGGTVTKRYLYELRVARRADPSEVSPRLPE